MKKEQFRNHLKKINKFSSISYVIIVLIAYSVRYTASAEETQQYMFQFAYTIIFLLLLVHLKANNLKQKAIIRYMTDSIRDIEL
jgi:hypothetical protein